MFGRANAEINQYAPFFLHSWLRARLFGRKEDCRHLLKSTQLFKKIGIFGSISRRRRRSSNSMLRRHQQNPREEERKRKPPTCLRLLPKKNQGETIMSERASKKKNHWKIVQLAKVFMKTSITINNLHFIQSFSVWS